MAKRATFKTAGAVAVDGADKVAGSTPPDLPQAGGENVDPVDGAPADAEEDSSALPAGGTEVDLLEVDLADLDAKSLFTMAEALQDALAEALLPLEGLHAVDPLGFGTARTYLPVRLLQGLPREDLSFRVGDCIGMAVLPDGMDLDLFAQCIVRMRAAAVE